MKSLYICFVIFVFTAQLFAQTHKTLTDSLEQNIEWRELRDEGRYSDAIECLRNDLNAVENSKQKHAIYWHIGQMYAFKNDYDSAVTFIKKSTSFLSYLFDSQFYWYYRGTMAFLKRDKKKLHKYYLKLWPYKNGYYRKNALMLKKLFDDFGKPYSEIYGTVFVGFLLKNN